MERCERESGKKLLLKKAQSEDGHIASLAWVVIIARLGGSNATS
jgi:hypothetical protein